jgi:large subunit ribosomal protein L3
MRMGILGTKVGMTQIFDENGMVVPVTVIDTKNCFIAQVKTVATDGYNALQVTSGERKPQNVSKAKAGHFKKAGVPAKAFLKEIRIKAEENISHLRAGQELTPTMFAKGDRVDVTGLTQGKGFQGVMRRHNFHGADATHGVHEFFRHGGSIGTNTFPGRVMKNKGMPGQMGNTKVTIPNLEVIEVRDKENLIFLKGAVPGFRTKGVLLIQTSRKTKKVPTDRSWTAAQA